MTEEVKPLKLYPFQQKLIDEIRAAKAAGKPIRLKYNRYSVSLDHAMAWYALWLYQQEAKEDKQ